MTWDQALEMLQRAGKLLARGIITSNDYNNTVTEVLWALRDHYVPPAYRE